MSEQRRFRNICFTWNNYPDDHKAKLETIPEHKYMVYGYEVGESGTKHLQGYVEFINPVRLTTLKKIIPKVHIEERKGTPEQAALYCKKDGQFEEEGIISKQGKRNDLDEVREILKTGGERDVVDLATSIQSIRFAQMYLKVRERQRNEKPFVVWLYGKAGTGKTQLAHWDAEREGLGDDIHIQSGQGKWWEGYDAHKVVIMDDVRSDFCSYQRMLNLLDKYGCRVENKGGSRQMLATRMYITAPVPPDEMWDTREEMQQLLRRIDVIQEIISFTKSNTIKGDALSQQKPEKKEDDKTSEETEGIEGGKDICEKSHAEARGESSVES